ncbi:MAG: DUF3418 domain-containing protein, partial [Bacteroidota bacterium]
GEAGEGFNYFGGLRVVEKALFQSLCKRLLRKNLRSHEDFDRYSMEIRVEIFGRAKDFRDLVIKILESYPDTRTAIYAVEGAGKGNRTILDLCTQLREDLDHLIPADFIETLPTERLIHLPRYLKALKTRAERGAFDPEKDRKKMARAEGFIKALRGMTEDSSPYLSPEKLEAIGSYRFMIEEFKVSLFAPELKTPFPISEKRLEEKRREIERML